MEQPTVAKPLLELKEVSKSYGKTQALVSIDLTLRPGSVHGLVGEDGAGKSTLVKILIGAVAPDGGGKRTQNVSLDEVVSSTAQA